MGKIRKFCSEITWSRLLDASRTVSLRRHPMESGSSIMELLLMLSSTSAVPIWPNSSGINWSRFDATLNHSRKRSWPISAGSTVSSLWDKSRCTKRVRFSMPVGSDVSWLCEMSIAWMDGLRMVTAGKDVMQLWDALSDIGCLQVNENGKQWRDN